MAKGSTGGSMQGRVVGTRTQPFQLNEAFCAHCGAAKNTPCIRTGGEAYERRGNRPETHRSEASRRGFEWPPTREQARRLGREGRRRR